MFDLIHQKLDLINHKLSILLTRSIAELLQEKAIMTTVTEVVDKITAETTVLRSIQVAVTGLSEGNTTIADEIAALKAQIAAGSAPDFSGVDAALADQKTVVDSLATSIPANTGP